MSPIEKLCAVKSVPAPVLQLVGPASEAFLLTRVTLRQALSEVGEFEGAEGVIFHAVQNLFNRIEEQTEGMLVSFVAGCPAAAETIARTVVEMSVNLMFIVKGHRAKRMFSFFRVYLQSHSKTLNEWAAFVAKNETGETADIIKQLIDERRKGLEALTSFTEQLASGCGYPVSAGSSDWKPKLIERFEEIGDKQSYWTIYHRLSAASHGNAEETIRWLIGTYDVLDSGNEKTLMNLASETFYYTAMMLRFGVKFYMEAAVHLCIIYNRLDAVKKLKPTFDELTGSIEKISDAAGVPSPNRNG